MAYLLKRDQKIIKFFMVFNLTAFFLTGALAAPTKSQKEGIINPTSFCSREFLELGFYPRESFSRKYSMQVLLIRSPHLKIHNFQRKPNHSTVQMEALFIQNQKTWGWRQKALALWSQALVGVGQMDVLLLFLQHLSTNNLR